MSKLQPADFNPRSISPSRLDELKQSLAADPLMLEARPVIALPDGTVICGNQRLLAARELGWEDIPVVTAELGEEQARLWALRDNNEYGVWDDDALATLLHELEQAGAELELAGFSESELDALLLASAAISEELDEAPALPDEPESKVGEIYDLGPHRLMCGDATDAGHVAALLAGEQPALLVTDPPYGVALDMAWRDHARAGKRDLQPRRRARGHQNRSIAGDHIADWSHAFELVPSLTIAYVWHADRHTITVGMGLERIGFSLAQLVIWDKGRFVPSRTHYQIQHEPCWYARKRGSPRFRGRRDQPSIWRHPSPKMSGRSGSEDDEALDHPTQKPIALYTRPLENHLRRGERFYDPFAGSGSGLIAAEVSSRRCLAMEIDPRYCDVIRRRWEAQAHG